MGWFRVKNLMFPTTGAAHVRGQLFSTSSNRVGCDRFSLTHLCNSEDGKLNSFNDAGLSVFKARQDVPPVPALLTTTSRHLCDCSIDQIYNVVIPVRA